MSIYLFRLAFILVHAINKIHILSQEQCNFKEIVLIFVSNFSLSFVPNSIIHLRQTRQLEFTISASLHIIPELDNRFNLRRGSQHLPQPAHSQTYNPEIRPFVWQYCKTRTPAPRCSTPPVSPGRHHWLDRRFHYHANWDNRRELRRLKKQAR